MPSFDSRKSSRIRWGAFLLALASLQFIVVMLVVEAMYPGYSPVSNFVSDLGASQSPGAWLFNASLWALGTLALVGTCLAWSAFPVGRAGRIGLGLLGLTWVAAFLIGVFPEQTGSVHTNVSAVAFFAAGLSLLFIGLAMRKDHSWVRYSLYTWGSGIFTLVAFVIFALEPGGTGIQGIWERLVILPILVWSIIAAYGLYRLARNPEGAPAEESHAPRGGAVPPAGRQSGFLGE